MSIPLRPVDGTRLSTSLSGNVVQRSRSSNKSSPLSQSQGTGLGADLHGARAYNDDGGDNNDLDDDDDDDDLGYDDSASLNPSGSGAAGRSNKAKQQLYDGAKSRTGKAKLAIKRTGASLQRMLTSRKQQEDFVDAQFIKPPVKVPWRAIGLALLLFLIGSILLTFGSLILTGKIKVDPKEDTSIPLIVIGSLVFLPGFYHLRLAYYAYRGYKGYSFDDIPDFD
ncbi:hypothetical protein CAOG_08809 [Capsaspora owczarzaki ATCC 30864]|uniref:Transmembrane protein 230 n=1 Tax=Capsaspora owczarzaki (strain ATCC 30864) TaxID=595528 RepID=A0A0D2VSF1_CAPO3|nr:hypothetical protein CAOG_08809 [Capsaspora owczarzaki ATCC 30864]KJE94012.1 hypothetical protein CAOG_008809 [Capsaspora owczarzaki ATCC 30864]|eukprot:XP_011270449.1 hypothetical protein CAOG_08809 [Capsaspora owczarzaki ATCC 30864]